MSDSFAAPTETLAPAYTGRLGTDPIPALKMPKAESDPEAAYRFIHDELMLDGSSRLNLATFVTTWMDPQADKLMAETFDKNMIDKDEYPATAEIETRCVNMVADLFHAEGLTSDPASATGVSTVGSSEAVMLGGLALKWRWRQRREQEGKDTTKPNLILGSNVQVVWEKFCRYFDVEPKYLPMERGRYVITPEQVRDAVDENTIGVVAILGTTFTGELEPVAEIAEALDEIASNGGPDVPLHVDAASGGFVVPFLHPELMWDFKVPRVVSINVSGHKYGMTYPASVSSSGARKNTYRKTWCSGSTISAATCRPSPSTSLDLATRSSGSTTTSSASASPDTPRSWNRCATPRLCFPPQSPKSTTWRSSPTAPLYRSCPSKSSTTQASLSSTSPTNSGHADSKCPRTPCPPTPKMSPSCGSCYEKVSAKISRTNSPPPSTKSSSNFVRATPIDPKGLLSPTNCC